MTKDELLALCSEAIDLSKVQQATYHEYDDGKRDPRSLFKGSLMWKTVGIVTHQMGLLADILLRAHTPEDLHKRRVRFLSIVFSFLDRFCGLPSEDQHRITGQSTFKDPTWNQRPN